MCPLRFFSKQLGQQRELAVRTRQPCQTRPHAHTPSHPKIVVSQEPGQTQARLLHIVWLPRGQARIFPAAATVAILWREGRRYVP